MDLMYKNELIGKYEKNSLTIVNQSDRTNMYFGSNKEVPVNILQSFIHQRIVPAYRRDIESVLKGAGLLEYDAHKIATITRLISPMDKFWLRESEDETYEDFIVPRLASLFEDNDNPNNALHLTGMHKKRYMNYEGYALGIAKERLHSSSYDVEGELAVHNIAKLLGVETCPVFKLDENTTFSKFEYDYLHGDITHMHHVVYSDLFKDKSIFSKILLHYHGDADNLFRMLILDFVTAQDDRHLSNLAVQNKKIYPLYDNGRALFFDMAEVHLRDIVLDVKNNSTFFEGDSYYDLLRVISNTKMLGSLVNLKLNMLDIRKAYIDAGFTEVRAHLLSKWTYNCLQELIKLDNA